LTKGPEAFNEVMGFLSSPMFKLLEVGLWAAILFHAFNGVRIVMVDFSKGSLIHKKLFAVLIAIAFVLWVIGSYLLVAHIKW
jgi:succinate dehydrogenase / fumarate reductase cytochrome b subunit